MNIFAMTGSIIIMIINYSITKQIWNSIQQQKNKMQVVKIKTTKKNTLWTENIENNEKTQ